MKEKLTINGKTYNREAEILWGKDFEEVTDEDIIDQGRWTTTFSQVVKHKESGRLFEIVWDRGSTEQQAGCETDGYSWVEVEPKVVSKTVYVPLARKE